MRWDYGQIYKTIRTSKGYTQNDVCGDFMSRSTLAKIESGEVIPSFERMVFLLEQIDMTLPEFKYICNEYHPSQRRKIMTTIQNQNSFTEIQSLSKLLEDCKTYLKTHHDVPIQNLYHSLQIILEIRKNGIENNETLQSMTQSIWNYLEPMDTWYISDLKFLGTILYHFDIETLPHIVEKILSSLEKYKNYRDIKPFQLTLLSNLSTIYLQKGLIKDCEQLTHKILTLSKELKVYNSLGFAQVRLGICQRDESLIDKGLTLLKLTEEEELVATLEKEVEQFYRQK
ncbi:Rgg/GadR/MutR family transcriptional regulator [Streptococcus hillyeri]|uniref:Rgg/GadR/MutR family transcriptional regulator n=1 Tax=Streptococcus hillyeri TaxID=2282420 RepID=A0A3L9DM08_9STRE|nr:Rgg/GadR/MutR family transcriptional regulator [Streptococcus hillyeri]RLY01724.1 Rgg/GadR/MutR family transcriptional regulator [Streptococcus hillyeri]